MALFIVILILMIAGSVVAVEIKNMLSAVIAAGIVGFGVSVMFLFLKAPDIAITQVIVEVLSLIILIRITTNADNEAIEKKIDNFANIVGLIFVGLFVAFCFWAFVDMTAFGTPIMRVSQHYLSAGLEETGAANMVAAVILDYRAYDTLGEAVVIFTSILGAFVILRSRGKKKLTEKDMEKVGIPE
ncbi:hypothetical protein DRQ33_01530 [bacterium]|nr:MAG: hypothetical protein DRQ33_01530 [bacterium]